MYLEMNYLDAVGPQQTISCPGCEKSSPQYPHQKTADGKALCFDCFENTKECSECSGLFLSDDLENDLCEDCGITCNSCGDRVEEQIITGINGQIVCPDCLENYHHQGPGCGNWTSDTEGNYCSECMENRGECNNCGDPDWNDNLIWYNDEEIYCLQCIPPKNNILPYDENPLDHLSFLPNPSGVYLGVELEVECPGEDKEKKAGEVLDQMGGREVICKEDGTLSNGFEIVSRPACLQGHRKIWDKLFENVPDGLVSFDSKNCGLHVHVDRSLLTKEQIERIVEFVNAEENEKFVTIVAQRRSDSYAKLKPGKKEVFSNDRYEAVNLMNDKTIELRIFKGSLKKESFFKSVEFTDALVAFCGDEEEKEMTYKAFCSWFSKDYYPNLANFLAEHNYIKESVCV